MRKLRESTVEAEPVKESDEEIKLNVTTTLSMPQTKIVKTSNGQNAEIDPEAYDLSTLDNFAPYKEGEPLPSPVIKTNRKGIRYVSKEAEPKFLFRGNEFIKVQRGLGGKKTSLFWTYKDDKPLHRRIRAYLRKKNFPGA